MRKCFQKRDLKSFHSCCWLRSKKEGEGGERTFLGIQEKDFEPSIFQELTQNVEEKKREKIAEMSLSLWARHVEGEEIQLTALHVDLVANTFTSKNSIIEIISKTWGNILLYIYHGIDLVNTFKSKNSNIEIISKIKKGKILN